MKKPPVMDEQTKRDLAAAKIVGEIELIDQLEKWLAKLKLVLIEQSLKVKKGDSSEQTKD